MASNSGGTVPMNHHWSANQRVAATLAKHGLVEDASWRDNGEPEWKITISGRLAADKSRAGLPELCFRCDKAPAVYVQFSGAQSGQEIGYPSAHLLCQECFDRDREACPDHSLGRTYRMTPVTATEAA